jgi:hypothetical protein
MGDLIKNVVLILVVVIVYSYLADNVITALPH